MINDDPALSQQLLDLPVGQAIPEVPADRHHDLAENETPRTPTEVDVHDEGNDASAQPARARDPAMQQCPLMNSL